MNGYRTTDKDKMLAWVAIAVSVVVTVVVTVPVAAHLYWIVKEFWGW